MSSLLITHGRVIDPSQDMDRVTNLLIENGKIAAFDIATDETSNNGSITQIDAGGKIVSPGLIDMHAYLGEPGGEDDETIQTGTHAAIAGGFTSIACAPDTNPPIDSQGTVQFVKQQAADANHCHVYPIACVSKSRRGEELSEMGTLVDAGAIAFSDACSPISNPELMRRALEYLLMFDKPLLSHPEVRELSGDGVMHEGLVSTILALPGMPADAESVMTGRDISLAESTGGRLHLMHISTAGSIELIRRAKARGARLTAEVSPQHFSLTDEALRSFDSNKKMNPPLRGQMHLEACIAGLKDGTLDVIASDHQPQAVEKKMRELDQAPFGVIALETTLSVVVTKLIRPGHLDWLTALEKMTIRPARVLGIPKGTLKIGADADVTIIDPDATWTVEPDALFSKSRNSPYLGETLYGRASTVIVSGIIKFKRNC
ncbi:MAG: dihydroorotase [Planctomycetota bacterium]|nr:dihydroorotase [Planctomycetota bacterium]